MAKNLDSKIIKKYEVLKTLVVPNLGEEVDYYNEAVEALRQNDPFIPLLHSRLGLGALTQLDQIYKDIIKDTDNPSGLINWYKLGRVAKIITYIKQIRPGYSLREVLPIQKAILQAESWRYENINCRISELRNNIDSALMESQLKREETSRLWDPEWIGLNDEDWSTIIAATSAQCCDFKKDDLILDYKGEEVHPFFYRLVSGSVNIINKVEGGKELPTNLRLRHQLRLMPIQRLEFSLQAQNIFGELSFFGKPSPCDVVALTNGIVYIIEIEKMIQFCLRTDAISRKFNRYLAWKAARRLKRKMENSVIRRMSTDGTGAKKPINIQEKMLKDVTLGENEKILKEYRCARLKKQVKFECLFIVTGQKLMFNCKMFGIKNTVIKPISLVQKIEVKDKTLFVDNVVMKDFEGHNINTVYEFITALWEREKMVTEDKRKEYEQRELTQTTPQKRSVNLMLDEADWKLITRGAQMLTFANEEVIIEKGHISTKLYQILNGTVQEQNISTNGKADYVKVLGKGELFGEVAFLSNRQASVSVVALQKTQVLVIEGYYLGILFQHDPFLAGRFFHHLAGIMSERLFEAGYF